MSTENIKRRLKFKRKRGPIPAGDFLDSGSTLLNLACTANPYHCFAKGHYYYFVGDSQSGKTFLVLTAFAEATLNKNFNDYRLIYDNSEDGALMDIGEFFGSSTAARLEPPAGTKQQPQFSRTVEDFYFNIDDAIEEGKPFIYILDSMDGLTTKDDKEKFKKQKKATREDKKEAGSYGMAKAKYNSSHMNDVRASLRDTKSILIIISQTRDKVGGMGFETKTRAGGRALTFYADMEIWTSIKGPIKKSVRGKLRKIGIVCSAKVKKNRIKGRERVVQVPLYHSVGIDDLGGCVNFLIDEGHWKKSKTNVKANEFEFSGGVEALISYIQEEGLERKLRQLTATVWNEIEEGCKVERKKKYV